MKDAKAGGGFIETALPGGGGGFIETALPVRKRLNHRGPITIDVSRAWYFITICAKERFDYGRAVSMKPPRDEPGRAVSMKPPRDEPGRAVSMKPPRTPFMVHVSEILDAARFRHIRGDWKLALFLVMPDHIHLIANFPGPMVPSSHPRSRRMDLAVADLKRWLATRTGLEFQRDYWETRIRDDVRFGEAFSYICNNPVRKNLCEMPRDWPYVMAFDRSSGNEWQHRGLESEEDGVME